MTVELDTSFIVPAPEVTPENTGALAELLTQAQEAAHCDTSQFAVGAIAIGASGKAYLGTNLEFPNQPLAQTVHAEQFAVALAHLAGESEIRHLVVSALPCGHCRQFLLELGNLDLPVTVIENGQWLLETTLNQLLPHPFTLADADTGMMSHQPVQLAYTAPANLEDLGELALEQASLSYVPYTESYTGVVIRLEDGTLLWGHTLESAAYNPSLPAIQMGLIHLVASQRHFHEMREVLLVEREGAPYSYSASIWNLVKSLSPLAQIEYATIQIQ